MNSDQLPPPAANLSFPPPDGTELRFSYLDSFVTSWVTPQSSQDPSSFDIDYWNESTPGVGAWKRTPSEAVPLNGSTFVHLDMFDTDWLGKLCLNYIDPLGSQQRIGSGIFHVDHDQGRSKAMTWNKDALSPSTTLSTSSKPATLAPTLSSTTPPTSTPSSSTSLFPPLPMTPPSLLTVAVTAPASATTFPSPTSSLYTQPTTKSSSSAPDAKIASITLGAILGILLTAVSVIFWMRRRRQRLAKQDTRTPPNALVRGQSPRVIYEKDTGNTAGELGGAREGWELHAVSVKELSIDAERL